MLGSRGNRSVHVDDTVVGWAVSPHLVMHAEHACLPTVCLVIRGVALAFVVLDLQVKSFNSRVKAHSFDIHRHVYDRREIGTKPSYI